MFAIQPLEVLSKLSKENDTKIILLVMDGVGDIPFQGKTPLEAAKTLNLDKLASEHSVGLVDPVFPGITPGSGPGHLSLFGYNPLKYDIGRGILEALGVDMEVLPGDVTARGNFCTITDGIVVDRRAGRISTEKNKELISLLSSHIKEIDGVKIILKSGKEHRFVILLRGRGLQGFASDTDPHTEGNSILKSFPEEGGDKIADIINKFTKEAEKILKEQKPANGVLLRGITAYPMIPQFPKLYKLKAAAIATYPMYRGIAKLVGMDVLKLNGETIDDEVDGLRKNFEKYGYFFFHVKKTDSYGEDGNFEKKVKVIESVDKVIPQILSLKPDVLAVTGDHSTPVPLKGHSWHPVPFLLYSMWTRRSNVKGFNENECAKGNLGRIPSLYITSLLLANALRLDKYGA